MDQEDGASGTVDGGGRGQGASGEPSHTTPRQHRRQDLWSSRGDWLEQEVRSLRKIVEELQKHPQLTPRGSNRSKDIVTDLERRVSELEQNRSTQREKHTQSQSRQHPGGKSVFPYLDIDRKVKGTLGKISDLEIRVGRLEEAQSKMGEAGTPQMKGTRGHRGTNKQEIGNTRLGTVDLGSGAKGTTRVSKIETRMDRREPREKRTSKAERRPGVRHFGQLSRDTVPFRSVSSSSDASNDDGGVREIYLNGSSRPVLCPLLGLDVHEHRNGKGERNSLLRHKMSLDKPKKMCATSGIPYTDSPQYWEVQVTVKLLDVLKPGHTIFEITLSQPTKEARRPFDHQEAVRLSLSYCKDHERICVMTTTGRDVYVKHDTDLIKNVKDVHTWIRFEIGILVDRKRKSAAFLSLRQNAVFAVVRDVGFYDDLWSVFGIVIYTTGNRFLVNMTLVSGSDIEITRRKKKLIEKVVEK